ncbi:MAG: M28 family peptidase, partial [Planctomycetota bacterium]
GELGRPVPILPGLHPHSDHFPFFLAGVPVANLAAPGSGHKGGRGWGHTIADTLDKVDIQALRLAVEVLARSLIRLAEPGGLRLPPRSPAEVETVLQDLGLAASLKFET